MSKKQWLLLIIVGVFVGYLIVSKINPTWGWSIDKVLGGAIGNAKKGIESTPIWQKYDVWFSGAFFAAVAALLVYRGRNVYDNIRGIARVRATGAGTGYQKTPTPQPVVIPEAQVTPQPQPQPVPVKQPEPEQEATT